MYQFPERHTYIESHRDTQKGTQQLAVCETRRRTHPSTRKKIFSGEQQEPQLRALVDKLLLTTSTKHTTLHRHQYTAEEGRVWRTYIHTHKHPCPHIQDREKVHAAHGEGEDTQNWQERTASKPSQSWRRWPQWPRPRKGWIVPWWRCVSACLCARAGIFLSAGSFLYTFACETTSRIQELYTFFIHLYRRGWIARKRLHKIGWRNHFTIQWCFLLEGRNDQNINETHTHDGFVPPRPGPSFVSECNGQETVLVFSVPLSRRGGATTKEFHLGGCEYNRNFIHNATALSNDCAPKRRQQRGINVWQNRIEQNRNRGSVLFVVYIFMKNGIANHCFYTIQLHSERTALQ